MGLYPIPSSSDVRTHRLLLSATITNRMGTSILFVSLLNYLQRNPNAHVVLTRKQSFYLHSTHA